MASKDFRRAEKENLRPLVVAGRKNIFYGTDIFLLIFSQLRLSLWL